MLGILGRRPRELAGLRGYICPYIFFPYVLEMVGSHPFSTFFSNALDTFSFLGGLVILVDGFFFRSQRGLCEWRKKGCKGVREQGCCIYPPMPVYVYVYVCFTYLLDICLFICLVYILDG